MKFLADMGISLRTVTWLRGAGYDVVHLRDEGLQRLPDDEILIKTRAEGRILLTIDLDFAQLLAVSGDSLQENNGSLKAPKEQVRSTAFRSLDGG
jgi:predicted nuclease of predicted toxin-antitoxin system